MRPTSLSLRDISLHFLEDEAILFDNRRQKLYATNTSAAVIWCCLQEDMAPEKVAEVLTDRLPLDRATAERYVDEAIRQWQLWGLFNGEESETGLKSEETADAPAPVSADLLTDPAALRRYRLLDTTFTVRFASRTLFLRVDKLLRHLTVDDPSATGPVFDLIPLERGYALIEHGLPIAKCAAYRQVAALTKAVMVYRALRECADFCAIHAGAVRRRGKCLLLPGLSGAGKSTLVAGLTSEGFELLGDDTAVLTRDGLAVRPVPCGICVKKDAWSALAVRFPHLNRTTIHDRPDGKIVRYLLPPEYGVVAQEEEVPAGWIVFPQFERDGTTALRQIGKGAAMKRLMPCFVPLRDSLTPAEVERFVRWLGDIPCYEMTVSSLTEAVALLGHLCR